MKNPIIVIAGPTASGKTDLAIELAREFEGEIINADSRTIYKEMDIATSKPLFDEIEDNFKFKISNLKLVHGVPHHLFDIVKPDENFTLSDYQKLAKEKITETQKKGKIPFLVGGTGLYIDSVVYNFNLSETAPDPKIREELEKLSETELYEKLAELDKLTADNIDRHNKRRLIRALEVVVSTNQSFYESQKRSALPENILYLAIETDREKLYQKINQRVDSWQDKGLIDETKHLINNYSLDLPSMTSIGYKEIAAALDCESEITMQEALDLMKQRTRNYAKRQLTWFKRNSDIVWVKSINEAQENIKRFLNS